MRAEVIYRPSNSIARIFIEAHERVNIRRGALFAITYGKEVNVKADDAHPGVPTAIEGDLFHAYVAGENGEQVLLAPRLPGDICTFKLKGETLLAQLDAYLASSGEISVESNWPGKVGMVEATGQDMLKISGKGMLVLAYFGAIYPIELASTESLIVESGHLVVLEEGLWNGESQIGQGLDFQHPGKEKFVVLRGPGSLSLQSRNPALFSSRMTGYR